MVLLGIVGYSSSMRKKIIKTFLLLLITLNTIIIHTRSEDLQIDENIIFDYISIQPMIQLPNANCCFSCIILPLYNISTASIMIKNPDGTHQQYIMNNTENGKFEYTTTFNQYGQYYFSIILSNNSDMNIQSINQTFWITSSIDDRDNDGMPDWWENRFGFNSENGFDGLIDSDNDGYTNKEEYRMQTHPLRNNFYENIWFELQKNSNYLMISLFIFILLCSLSFADQFPTAGDTLSLDHKFHNAGNVWQVITNLGYLGFHCYTTYAPQLKCEYPIGSGVSYLYGGRRIRSPRKQFLLSSSCLLRVQYMIGQLNNLI